MAISKEKILRILEGIDWGLRDKAIALLADCELWTVSRVRSKRDYFRNRIFEKKLSSSTGPKADYERCPACGALTRLPCLACVLNDPNLEKPEKTPENRSTGVLEVFLDLDLLPEDRNRYNEVRKWRDGIGFSPSEHHRSITKAFMERFAVDSE